MAQLNFDASQVAPEMGFDTVPAGWYNALIDQSELKPTKGGDGAYLELRYNILDGQFQNRKIFQRLNIRNANAVAQEIAYKQLSAVAHAAGILQVADSQQLHGIPLKIKVKIRKDSTGQYEDSNEITSVKNINEQVDMGGQQAGAPAAAPQGGFGVPAGFGAPPAAPAGFGAPPQAPAPAQPQQPAAQPWQQAPVQQPAAQPAQAPQAAPAPAGQPWQQPQGGQPWQQPQQPAQAPQQPAPQPQAAPAAPPAGAMPPGFNPQAAVPPWQQPQQ